MNLNIFLNLTKIIGAIILLTTIALLFSYFKNKIPSWFEFIFNKFKEGDNEK